MPEPADLQARPVRVVHIAQSIAGGVASFLEEIAGYQEAVLGRANVSFVVPAGSEAHLPNVDPAQFVCFRSSSRRPAALLDFARTARQAIRRLNPDIVHLHSTFAGAAVRSMNLPSGTRAIYCPHGWAFAMDTSDVKKRLYAAVERRLASRTDIILVNSQSEYDVALRFGLPADKMRVVKNGIAWTERSEQACGEGPIRVAFIGRHDRQKGLDILLDAIRRFPLPHIHFEITGDKVLNKGSDPAGPLPSNVTFHGWISRARILQLLESVDAVCMPSRWDAAPIVATEAMRAGVPVIASNRGALPEIVQDGVGGYIFDLDDPDSLGRILQQLDRNELKRLGSSARTRWELEYVSDRMNQRTYEAYGDVLRPRERDHRSADRLVEQPLRTA